MNINYYTIVIGLLFELLLFYKLPKLTKTIESKEPCQFKISVIIPARNEENNLPNLLSDLKSQTISIHEIICVDDNSDDNTLEVINSFGVKKASISYLPYGWKGKTWACQTGANIASGNILLFLDADVRLSQTAIESLLNNFIEKQMPVSVQPYHTVKNHYEHLSLFFNLVEICSTGMCLWKAKKTYGFFGPVFMISKDLFDMHKGYEIVKNEAIEDFGLGNYYNSIGIKIHLLTGAKEISFRMYPDSAKSLIEAWCRNFSSGSKLTKPLLLFMVIIWIACLTAIPIELVLTFLNHKTLVFLILSILYIINSLNIYRIVRKIGSYPLYSCLLYPIYLIAFHLIFLQSILRTDLFKSTTWKGRNL